MFPLKRAGQFQKIVESAGIMTNFREKFEMLGGLRPLFKEFHPVTPGELDEIETYIQVRLPKAYRDFLLEIGGVAFGAMLVVRMMEQSPRGGANKKETIDRLFGAKPEGDFGLLENVEMFRERFPKNVIPIGQDLFGNMLFLVIKGKKRGQIYFFDHDYGELYLAADSFEDFLNRLEISEEPGLGKGS